MVLAVAVKKANGTMIFLTSAQLKSLGHFLKYIETCQMSCGINLYERTFSLCIWWLVTYSFPDHYRPKPLRPSDAYMHKKSNRHWFRQWLVTRPAPSHYLNQCWNIVNWNLSNKMLLQTLTERRQPFCLGLNVLNLHIFVQRNALEVIICYVTIALVQGEMIQYIICCD